MNEDDKPNEQTDAPAPAEDGLHTQDAPADALSRTPDELEEEQAAAKVEPEATDGVKPKKVSKLKLFFKRINVYLLIFILVVIVAIAVTIVFYLNSQKPPVEPTVASQELTEEALRGLANKDASVGGASQTLTIQGNAIIDGQTLMRGNPRQHDPPRPKRHWCINVQRGNDRVANHHIATSPEWQRHT